jgi:hypothetical protein
MRIKTLYNGRAYTAGRDAKGRFAGPVFRISVRVTERGHWYRSDDPRDGFHNDPVCRGCAHHGHFDYILDNKPCTRPATPELVAEALLQRPMTEPPVAAATVRIL